jgi:hypothetical protein
LEQAVETQVAEEVQKLSLDPKPEVVTASVLEVTDATFSVKADKLLLKAKTTPTAVKVLAIYGQKATMLSPTLEGDWQAEVSINALTDSQSQHLTLRAWDIEGKEAQKSVAAFGQNSTDNYNFSGQVAGKSVQVFGKQVDMESFEYRFYLFFIAAFLTFLVMAIAIKRHVQHLSVVANGSFVAILAILLWMG